MLLPCFLAACVQARASALESELRKSKRAEQKLQALLYRLRQDVAGLGSNPGLFDNLQDVRNLEYEVDFLTNKCKVSWVQALQESALLGKGHIDQKRLLREGCLSC